MYTKDRISEVISFFSFINYTFQVKIIYRLLKFCSRTDIGICSRKLSSVMHYTAATTRRFHCACKKRVLVRICCCLYQSVRITVLFSSQVKLDCSKIEEETLVDVHEKNIHFSFISSWALPPLVNDWSRIYHNTFSKQ